jgi:hypothetical protein
MEEEDVRRVANFACAKETAGAVARELGMGSGTRSHGEQRLDAVSSREQCAVAMAKSKGEVRAGARTRGARRSRETRRQRELGALRREGGAGREHARGRSMAPRYLPRRFQVIPPSDVCTPILLAPTHTGSAPMMMAPSIGFIFWNETAKGIIVQKKPEKGQFAKKLGEEIRRDGCAVRFVFLIAERQADIFIFFFLFFSQNTKISQIQYYGLNGNKELDQYNIG